MGFGLVLLPVLSTGESTVQLYTLPQFGYTALHFAAKKGHSEIVKLLLKAGAVTDIHDKVQYN